MQAEPGVTEVSSVPDAYVPVMKIKVRHEGRPTCLCSCSKLLASFIHTFTHEPFYTYLRLGTVKLPPCHVNLSELPTHGISKAYGSGVPRSTHCMCAHLTQACTLHAQALVHMHVHKKHANTHPGACTLGWRLPEPIRWTLSWLAK